MASALNWCRLNCGQHEFFGTDKLRDWVRNWQVVGPRLEQLRREEIRNAKAEEAIKQSDLAFKATLRNTSGLVEFQKLLRKPPQKWSTYFSIRFNSRSQFG
jgi:hypothetical protein